MTGTGRVKKTSPGTDKDAELMALARWSSPMHKSVCHTQLLPLGLILSISCLPLCCFQRGKPIVLPRLFCPLEFYTGVRKNVSGMYILSCAQNHWLKQITSYWPG